MNQPFAPYATLGNLNLLNDRVVQDASDLYGVALLGDIDGVEVGYTEVRPYLQLAGLIALMTAAGAYATWDGAGLMVLIFGGLLALVFLVAYLRSRRARVSVHAGELEMTTWIDGKSFDVARTFANQMSDMKAGLQG